MDGLVPAHLHAGSSHGHDDGADEPESASKRRRRSEDRDVAEATLDADAAPAAKPVNGHSLGEANGGVPPEAAFWSALEDANDEVSASRLPLSCRELRPHKLLAFAALLAPKVCMNCGDLGS